MSYTIGDITRRVNAAYELLVGKILQIDGDWEWDDTNWGDQPIGTFTLINNQQSYTLPLPSTTVPGANDFDNYLTIKAVEVLDLNNRYIRLKPIDHSQLGGLSPDEYFGVNSSGTPVSGFPAYYDKVGDSIYLYPSPVSTSVTLAAGLQIYYQREPDIFTTSDTTQSPGISAPYHILLAYMAAEPYCALYKPERVAFLERKIQDMTIDMIKFYSKREKDVRHIMTMKKINYI